MLQCKTLTISSHPLLTERAAIGRALKRTHFAKASSCGRGAVTFQKGIDMNKLIAAAALAATFVTAPAFAQEIRIPVAGKSQEQLQAEVTFAARTVCVKEVQDESFRLYAFSRCMRDTLESMQPQLQQLAQR